MSVITVSNLTKNYGDVCALDNISLTLEENKIYGLLGRNGAGKTTLLNIINNRIFKTSGKVTIDSQEVNDNCEAISKIYFMAEKNLYPDSLKVKDIFKWTKEFYPNFDMDYALELSKRFKLNINKKFKELSTGYCSICKIINTMASGAEVLIFDEPVLGLDANHRDMFYKELMENYIKHPKTIIISTHIIEEVAELLEHVIIIKNQKVMMNESVEELLNRCYCISGLGTNVEAYIKGKECIHIEEMAAFKSAILIGKIGDEEKKSLSELELEISKVELQKLFIYLTSERGE